jgi:hypothetical protein
MKMLTPVLEQMNQGQSSYRTTGSNCKELEEQPFETLLADNEDV